MPTLEGNDPAKVLEASLKRFDALFAPMTPEEHAGKGPSVDLASFVVAAPSAPTSAPVSIRRRAGNTPEPSPDRTGSVASASGTAKEPVAPTPTAAPAPALAPVIEAPSAPSTVAVAKRRSAAAAPTSRILAVPATLLRSSRSTWRIGQKAVVFPRPPYRRVRGSEAVSHCSDKCTVCPCG